jgi:hypothetical protein
METNRYNDPGKFIERYRYATAMMRRLINLVSEHFEYWEAFKVMVIVEKDPYCVALFKRILRVYAKIRKICDYYIEKSRDDKLWYSWLLDNGLAGDLIILESYDIYLFASNVMSELRFRDGYGGDCGSYQGDGGGDRGGDGPKAMHGGGGGGALQQHRLSIFEEKAVCNSQFEELYQSGQIEFMILGSSQGRHALRDPNHDSTDGCSVIAGLNVVNHISTLDIDDVITRNH